MILQIPGKVFLWGEYAALNKGPAVVAALNLQFQLEAEKKTQIQNQNIFNSQSPAGKWLLKNHDFFENYHLEFNDPLKGRGGLGASTAQFALAYYLKNPQIDIWKMHQSYIEFSFDGRGMRPSGYDLIGQVLGSVHSICEKEKTIQKLNAKLSEFQIHFVHTGKKLATHEHLSALDLKNFSRLEALSECVTIEWQKNGGYHWVSTLNAFDQELENLKLVADFTQNFKKDLKAKSWCITVKGCGAMGADILMVVTDRYSLHAKESLITWCQQNGCQYLISLDDVSQHGMEKLS